MGPVVPPLLSLPGRSQSASLLSLTTRAETVLGSAHAQRDGSEVPLRAGADVSGQEPKCRVRRRHGAESEGNARAGVVVCSWPKREAGFLSFSLSHLLFDRFHTLANLGS